MSLLDNLKLIHERDKQDALGVASKQSEQYLHSFNFSWKPPKPIYEVMVAGMGGSGLAAKAYKTIGNPDVPFSILQSYDLPHRADENTLLICSSYSGNTEETLSVFRRAMDPELVDPRPMIVVVASGGKLLEQAKEHDLPYIQLPQGYQPRYTFGFQYRALTEIFASTPLKGGELEILETAAKWLPKQLEAWLPTNHTKNNPAKELALELMGKSIVIYSGPNLFPAAYKWKISFNENAKNIAWCNELPEFNHNEMLGWTSHPVEKPYGIVELHSDLERKMIQRRFNVTAKLLSGKRPHSNIVKIQGDDLLKQLLWTAAYGDFVSLYLALLNGLDPTPVDLIEKFKKALG